MRLNSLALLRNYDARNELSHFHEIFSIHLNKKNPFFGAK